LNRFCSLHSKVVFNDLNIFVDLGNFLMGIYESQRKVAGSIHLLTIDSFGLHDTFQHNVLSDDITNFSTDGRNGQLKYKLLRYF